MDDDLGGVGVGEGVDSERLGDVEKGTELEDVARWKDEEASVGAFERAVSPASDLGDGGAGDDKGDDEGAGATMTRPTCPRLKSKSGPLQHPVSPSTLYSTTPQHQLIV